MTCPSYVRATKRVSRSVPPKNAGKAPHHRYRNALPLPSEGRGHRFESCRVRQFSVISETGLAGLSEHPSELRPFVPGMFLLRPKELT